MDAVTAIAIHGAADRRTASVGARGIDRHSPAGTFRSCRTTTVLTDSAVERERALRTRRLEPFMPVRRARRVTGRSITDRRASLGARGQALVEFSLVITLFLVMLTAVIEFSLAFHSLLSISYASREASLIAAQAGNAQGADCAILASVETSISAPADDAAITEVRIYKADRNGNALATNRYVRSGSMTCTFHGGSLTVPYTLSGSAGYPETTRCNILAGCPANSPMPATTAVDNIGVEVRYTYPWHTPLRAFLGGSSTGLDLTKGNVMRMEPVL
jgi:Flp pilus assembly protein TadG